MLRYKTETRPGLVALYDIRPGNGAGPFLQPRGPHGATFLHVGRCEPSVGQCSVHLLELVLQQISPAKCLNTLPN